ncbi:methyl-accepting chemotaxis protein [Pseudodesulfovibrio sp. zrk46]|nr:methyl-accepting chemotaxis protein [Pseudodesulfovibrio sp. zrk46]
MSLVLLASTIVTTLQAQDLAVTQAKEVAAQQARAYASELGEDMDLAMTITRELANVYTKSAALETPPTREYLDSILIGVLETNAKIAGSWCAFLPGQFDDKEEEYMDVYKGAYRNWYYRDGSTVASQFIGTEGMVGAAWFDVPFAGSVETITEPYSWEANGKTMWLSSTGIPIKKNGRNIGVLGVDFYLNDLQDTVLKIKPFETGRAGLISNEGSMVAHPNPDLMGKKIGTIVPREHTSQVENAIKRGQHYEYITVSEATGEEEYFVYVPVTIGRTTTPWSLAVVIPMDKVREQAHSMAIMSTAIGLGSVIVLLIVLVVVANIITKPIRQGIEFAETMANGDLTATIDVDQKDEVGMLANALRNMAGRLRAVIGDVRTATDNVATGSGELSASSQVLSQGATEQAANVEEVSSSMEEMAANIQSNAESASKTEQIATKAAADAEESGKAVSQAMNAMTDIAERISVIEDIARQTNLLALNAAIEAARAGEHGKGFAVVAAEVRKLAERSGTAAAEISELSTSTVKVAQEAGEKLDTLVPDIQQTAQLIQEIASASQEQNAGVSQINGAIQQLDHVIQQNASASEEMASTSDSLAGEAAQLQNSVSFFNTGAHHAAYQQPTRTVQTRPTPARPLPTATPRASGVSLTMDDDDGGFERF